MVIKFDRYFPPAGENRGIHLYLPDDYYESQERYPVLYMFDGHNLFFDCDATFGKCLGLKEFLDHWGKKMIVVGLACAADDLQRVHEYCPYHIQSRIYGDLWGRGDETVNWIVHDLKPWIDGNYRTWPFREATAIAGYSMGGMMSLFTVLRYNRWFSKAAVISPALLPAMATFYGNAVSLEKEPVQAIKSAYLKERFQQEIQVRNMMAHIRLATRGVMEYANCHPFVLRDNDHRCWTLAHNGTIFDYPRHNPYLHQQKGRTDSERILFFLVDQVNQRQLAFGRSLTKEERFALLDALVGDMAKGNKLNLLIYDGELLYVHTNYADSLYISQRGDTLLFATTPLDRGDWRPHPFTTLCAYCDGQTVFQGTNHGREYRDNAEDMHMIFADYAGL